LGPLAIEYALAVADPQPIDTVRDPHGRGEIFLSAGGLTIFPHGYEPIAVRSNAGYLLIAGAPEGILGGGSRGCPSSSILGHPHGAIQISVRGTSVAHGHEQTLGRLDPVDGLVSIPAQ
jgi:hypothetical protein